MSKLSIWLTCVILLTIIAFLAVFKPITLSPRKDPSDASLYLRAVNADAKWEPTTPPPAYASLIGNKNMYLYTPQHDLRLGLDLRGGMRVVLLIPDRAEFNYKLAPELKSPAAASKLQVAMVRALVTALGPEAMDSSKVQTIVNERQIQVITQPQDQEIAKSQLTKINAAVTQVFEELKVQPEFAGVKYDTPAADTIFKQVDVATQKSVLTIMEKRLNGTGMTEVSAQAKGTNQVVLEIPGVKDPERVRELLRTTAMLEFRLIPQEMSVNQLDDQQGVTVTDASGAEVPMEQAVSASYLVMPGSALDPHCDVTYDQKNTPAVSFQMAKKEDQQRFGTITQNNIGRQLAIVLDGVIISAPQIKDAIPKNGIIQGNFTMQQAKDLAVLLNAGALPVPVSIVENRTISATLGADSVTLSMIAGLVGLGVVMLFMGLYYRLPGLMANIALMIYVFLSLAVLKAFDATLTLPGIAGLVISVGMAVDANVIIFERLKEELRMQKPLATAIDVAFSRAWTAILDSNVASLITGSVLYMLGTGAIRGFAVTLMIGVVVSLFTAVTVTRLLMKLMIRGKASHNLSWYGV